MSPISSRKSVPPCGLLEETALGDVGAGEGAAHVSEEFALEQTLRDRRAVDRDERLRRAAAREVDGARDDFLAGAALAADQHARAAARDLADQREDLAHRGALADQLAHRRGLVDGAAQAPVLFLERAPFEGAFES